MGQNQCKPFGMDEKSLLSVEKGISRARVFFGHFKEHLTVITGASRRLEPVIKCCSFLSFFQCLVSRAPLSAVTESLS